jgi:hypothetical protein
MAGCCEYGDEPSGSGATELVMIILLSEFEHYGIFYDYEYVLH